MNIGNNVYPLSMALRRKGIRSDCFVFGPHRFGYPFDYALSKSGNHRRFLNEIARVYWLIRILRKYNTIHFNFGSTLAGRQPPSTEGSTSKKLFRLLLDYYLNLFQLIELRLFKFFKIKMFIHYQGDDVRQGGPMKELEYSLLQGTEKSYYSLEADKFKATQMKRITAFMEKIYYVNPDLEAILLPDSQFIPYSHINVSKYTIPRRSSKKKQ
jgi:hypothetical protein